MTLQDSVLSDLQKGESLTALDGWLNYGTLRLASVIHELRKKGYVINAEKIQHQTKRYGQIIISRYSIAPKQGKLF